MYGSGKEEDDHVISYALSRYVTFAGHMFRIVLTFLSGDLATVEPELVDGLATAQDEILGDPDEMLEELHKVQGKLVGGTRFQRGDRARPLEGGPNCYPLSLSWVISQRRSGPAACNKTGGVQTDEEVRMRTHILQVRFALSLRPVLLSSCIRT